MTAALCMGLAGIGFYSWFASQADETLLHKIALLSPGQPLESAKSELGHQMYVFSDAETMAYHGSIKDRIFCQGKKLYWFTGGGPPWTVLEVYTDLSDKIVYVTWQPL